MVLALLLLALVLFDLVARPTFRRLAFRNIARRKGEAALVVLGALLGTAIITASFVVGDTVEGSIRDGARTNLGPVDQSVRTTDADTLDLVVEAVTAEPLPGGAETMPIVATTGVVATPEGVGDRRAEPSSGLLELDLDTARAFGTDPAATGLAEAGPPLAAGEAILAAPTARTLGVSPGDEVTFYAFDSSVQLEVRDVLPEVGLMGYLPSRPEAFDVGGSQPVVVAPGTIAELQAAAGEAAGGTPPTTELLVANGGDPLTSVAGTDAVVEAITARVEGLEGVEVIELKRDLLDAAADQGESLTQLYQGIGFFSVIAGILLLVNLFVMLAEERKTELGMLRALGFKRNHLVRAFAMEGAIYSVIAAAAGAVVGIGVGWAIIKVASSIFNSGDDDAGFPLVVSVPSLVTGAAIGLIISMVTVWGTSLRISRLNIIQAIRDLSDGGARRSRWWTLVLAGLGVAFGVLQLVSGLSSEQAPTIIAGPAIALFSSIPLLRRFLPDRAAVLIPAALGLLWGLFVFSVAGDALGRADISAFVVQGIVLVASAVTLSSAAEPVWHGVARGMARTRSGLAVRLGLAYPLSRRFRTGMLLGMYAIVVFTITFMSVLSGIFTSQVPTVAADTAAGYDLYLDSNPANPIPAQAVADDPQVAATAVLASGVAQFSSPKHQDPQTWRVTGFDESLLARGVPSLETRAEGFADDAAAFAAVLDDPTQIIVSPFFLQTGGGPPENNIKVGDPVTAIDPATGATEELTVAGVLAQDVVFNGAFVGADHASAFLGGRTSPSRLYVAAADGVDPAALAAELQGQYLTNGARARTFLERAETVFERQNSFFRLLQGYLALGLLIGIAGLGVVMVRAVRERRRQIGMLRAMGVSSRVVRRAFVLESAFVATQGIAIGMVLGAVTSYQLLVNSDAFGDQPLDFSLPWTALAIILVVPLAASLLATAAPATQAARIRPAVALRIAD